jgi:hypothetical protein
VIDAASEKKENEWKTRVGRNKKRANILQDKGQTCHRNLSPVQQLADYYRRLLPILKKHTSTFLPLLKVWDPVLCHHLTRTLEMGIGIQESTPLLRILASWIPGWFTQDISNVSVLLRLWDVFLVSRPTCVMYVHKCMHKCMHTYRNCTNVHQCAI